MNYKTYKAPIYINLKTKTYSIYIKSEDVI